MIKEKKASATIWSYLILSVAFLMAFMIFLVIFFKFELDKEIDKKIGSAESLELIKLNQYEDKIISGKLCILSNGKNISIEKAITILLR